MSHDAKTMRLRWHYLPWAIAAVVFGGYYMLWRAGAAKIKSTVAEWAEDQRTAGMNIAYGPVKASGFPFFLRVHIDAPDIAYADEWRWRTETLTIDALPYDLRRLIFSVRGEQKLSTQTYGEWRIAAEEFLVSIADDKAKDWIFATTINGATARQPGNENKISLGSLVFDLSPDAADRTTLVLALAATDAAVGPKDGTIRLDRLQTVIQTTQIHALGDDDTWRNAGGAVKINGLLASVDDANLSVSGDIGLDADHAPAGLLTTEIVAPGTFVEALAAAGVIAPDDAEQAVAALTLAAIAGGGKLKTPIELKDGGAHIGSVTIADFSRD